MTGPLRVPGIDSREAHERLHAADAAVGGTGTAAPLLVDVREPSEYAEFRAEGAVLLPLSTFMERYRELPRDRPLLMICRTGARSGQATGFLLANGWTDVVNVEGGTMDWERQGLPIRRGAPAPGEGDLPA